MRNTKFDLKILFIEKCLKVIRGTLDIDKCKRILTALFFIIEKIRK